jgi:hypothetical protein
MNTLIDFLAQLGNLRLADPGQSHRLHQIVDPPGLVRRRSGTDRAGRERSFADVLLFPMATCGGSCRSRYDRPGMSVRTRSADERDA